MGLFSFLRGPDIDQGVRDCRDTPGALLLDVRETDEYSAGHIPGSLNIPLSLLPMRCAELGERDRALFVYCLSGARSAQAASYLQGQGFVNAKNIGGISAYSGKVER